MRKYFLIVPVTMLLAAGCGSTPPTVDNNAAIQPPVETKPVTATNQTNQSAPARPAVNADTPKPTSTKPANSGYTLAQVAAANSADKCWSVVGQSVYDLTSWINKHPGGSKAILNICGKDGTAAFTKQHGGQAKAEAALAQFRIGTFSN